MLASFWWFSALTWDFHRDRNVSSVWDCCFWKAIRRRLGERALNQSAASPAAPKTVHLLPLDSPLSHGVFVSRLERKMFFSAVLLTEHRCREREHVELTHWIHYFLRNRKSFAFNRSRHSDWIGTVCYLPIGDTTF